MTGYLLVGLFVLFGMWRDPKVPLYSNLFWTAFILFSNYTFSWFSDYQRTKGGMFSWYFTRFGTGQLGILYSTSQNYQNVSVSKGWFGTYNVNSKIDWWKHFWMGILITVIAEFVKFLFSIPIAFVSIFIHKRTIRKYRELLAEASKNA